MSVTESHPRVVWWLTRLGVYDMCPSVLCFQCLPPIIPCALLLLLFSQDLPEPLTPPLSCIRVSSSFAREPWESVSRYPYVSVGFSTSACSSTSHESRGQQGLLNRKQIQPLAFGHLVIIIMGRWKLRKSLNLPTLVVVTQRLKIEQRVGKGKILMVEADLLSLTRDDGPHLGCCSCPPERFTRSKNVTTAWNWKNGQSFRPVWTAQWP